MLKVFFQITFLLASLLAFGLTANAQMDCFYGFRIHVRDSAGKPIAKAKHELVPLDKKFELPPYVSLSVRDGIHLITSLAGSSLPGDFLLRVSADGFETFEQKVKYPVCEFQSYELKLQRKGSTAQAHFERLASLRGRILVEGGNPIRDADIKTTNLDGRIYQTMTYGGGYYVLDLPKGANTILVTHPALDDEVIENYQVDTFYSELNVTMKLRSNLKDPTKIRKSLQWVV